MNILNGLMALGVALVPLALFLLIATAVAWDTWSEQNDYLRRKNRPVAASALTAATAIAALTGAFLIGATI